MSSRPWICLRCVSRTLRPLRPRWSGPLRLYSSATRGAEDHGLSATLLSRARTLAKEHAALSSKQNDSFDTKAAKRIGEIAAVSQAIKEWDDTNESMVELRSILDDPSTDEELRTLAHEDMSTATENLLTLSTNLKKSLIPRHPFADLPCLVEIRPGAGGSEAGIFAAEILRMYTAFCSRSGLRPSILKKDTGESGGGSGDETISEAVMEIQAPGSYELLRTEAGVHRVQRVPATETKGRTHTSAVSVMILPSFDQAGEEDSPLSFENPNSDYYIDPKDVQSEKFRSGGAGGQHVNKTESAVRLTHVPTGTVVSMQDSRSQHDNRRKAWQLLRARIAQQRREIRDREMMELRRGAMGGVNKTGRGDKVRTYNFSQSRCTDHRSGTTIHNVGDVMDGGESLGKIMDSVRSWLVDQEVAALSFEEQEKK